MKKGFLSKLTTTQKILLSFLLPILLGSALLALPVSAAGGRVPYLDALFTSATSICVTGLVTVPTFSTWSTFGQIVILLCIQIGGLGVVTCLSWFMVTLHRRMRLSDRLLIQDAMNLNTFSGVITFIRRVFLGTLLLEGVGTLLYLPVFLRDFGARGIWVSVFTAVSAFCNAGIDILGPDSLCPYRADVYVNLVTSLLIILGGIGYIVWWDVLRVLHLPGKRRVRALSLHSKLVLLMTAVLLAAGTLLFLLFESGNPATLGALPPGERLLAAFFQSVTARTAGFATIPQENLSQASVLTMLPLMFIGASPVGTAGGVKTVTIAVLFASAFGSLRGKDTVGFFGRAVSRSNISRAVAVVCAAAALTFISSVLTALVTGADGIDVLFEVVSAIGTVGLSRGLTPALGTAGKIIIIITMYFGRVGPISFLLALNRMNKRRNLVRDPVEEISIG